MRERRRRRRRGQDRVDPVREGRLEVALDQRPHLLRPQVIGVVVPRRQHIGADHHPPPHLGAEALGAGALVHLGDALVRADPRPMAVAHPVVAGEVRRRLGRRDDVVGRQRVLGVRQLMSTISAPASRSLSAPSVPERLDLRRHAVDAVLPRNADPPAAHVADRAPPRSPAPPGRPRSRSFGSCPAIAFEHDRRVAHRLRQRPRLVERRGEGDDAPARAAPIGRLHPDDAGEGRRLADRAAGIGAGGPEARGPPPPPPPSRPTTRPASAPRLSPRRRHGLTAGP